ncbi:PepSY domain-containing protein [Synoicihabitans lomoniglobus]|uniref:PepSY domain-containing protein n=1 Tax=Synoicihabitans lomoniglobus TaxID=2909285 RepID=A0AAF0CPY8_9BACT|nr:PepSY domain-containing protein [Opitutaceae bacterium LMO-M01]WED65918.1 PepSY domain-containing protein [Opitutaceae bacterium LMO-M01]
MKTFSSLLLILLVSAGVCLADSEMAGSIAVPRQTPKWQLPALAKLSATDAIEVARAAEPGAVVEVKLKVDDHFLIYEVEIVRADHTMVELAIDAGTGAILEVDEDN